MKTSETGRPGADPPFTPKPPEADGFRGFAILPIFYRLGVSRVPVSWKALELK